MGDALRRMVRNARLAARSTLRPSGNGSASPHERSNGGRGIHPRRLDDSAWLFERGRRRQYVELGVPEARSGLLVDLGQVRTHMSSVQRTMEDWLAHEHVAHVLRRARINCVLDVGANAGQYAEKLRGAGFTGRIVSFEPVAEFVEKLERKAADDPDWWVCPYALGEEDTTAEINTTPGKRLSSLLPASEFGLEKFTEQLSTTQVETIEVRRLDSVYDEVTAGLRRPRTYLKMDTQGFDVPTFRGAGDRIEDIVAMQSEVGCVPIYEGMPRLPEQLREYESRGFQITGMYPVTRHGPTMRVIEFDMVMVRPDRLPRRGAAARAARAGSALSAGRR